MKIIMRLFIILIFFSVTLTGCYYDKEDLLYPSQTSCDTSIVTYGQTIAPIMVANCNICHSTAMASGGVVTDNYNGLSIVAQNGQLWSGVSWQSGFSPMPKGYDKLSACNLAKIKKWVDAGALNN